MTGPTPADWARVTAIFHEVEPCSPTERSARLAVVPPAIRAEVEGLLRALDREAGRFAGSAFDLLGDGASAALVSEAAPGSPIGPYRIVREIGRGGMGVVYEAVRADADYRKRVAIKLVSLGARTAQVMQRFRRERRILAGLEHRNVAALLDGGVTDDGLPYFALEYVEGTAIDRYVSDRALPLAERLQLIRQVCGAIEYAHQRLVIHRDLKPGNILVTADGTVKLLDFGVAKLLTDDDATGPDRTDVGGPPYTLAYASPEQLLGEPLTTAADIHGIGIVLYQVATGRHPFRGPNLPPIDVRRRILEEPPPPTSLGRDFDAIVGLALRKRPADRYPSAGELGEDLRRFLAGQPLLARPGSRVDQAAKFVRRHRAAVAAGALAAATIVVATAATVRQARRIAAERARAEAVNGFLQEMLSAPDPTQLGRDARITDLLGSTAARLAAGEVTDPVIRADLERTLGTTYAALGLHDSAAVLLVAAVARGDAALGAGHPASGRNRLALAALEAARGRGPVAESLFVAAIAVLRRDRPQSDAVLARGLADYGNLLFNVGRFAEAEPVVMEALSVGGTGLPSAQRVAALNTLGLAREHAGDPTAAKARYREALAAGAGLTTNLAAALLGPLANLANTLKLQDSLPAADSLEQLAVAHAMAAYGPRHAAVGATLTGLADIRRRRGNLPAAERDLREALAILQAALPADHLQQAPALSLLGLLLCEHGRAGEGEPLLRRALAIRVAQLPPGHWFIANLESALSVCLGALGRPAEARAMARSGYDGLVRALGPDHPRSREAAARLPNEPPSRSAAPPAGPPR
ncbi:MAG: protein kinase [Gemmatimonadales bacterium]